DTVGAFATPRTISLQTALPQFPNTAGALSIAGTGPSNLTIRRDSAAAGNFRIFDSLAPALTLTGFTITGGNLAGDGAGLQAANTINLDNMVFSNNTASGPGKGGAVSIIPGGS